MGLLVPKMISEYWETKKQNKGKNISRPLTFTGGNRNDVYDPFQHILAPSTPSKKQIEHMHDSHPYHTCSHTPGCNPKNGYERQCTSTSLPENGHRQIRRDLIFHYLLLAPHRYRVILYDPNVGLGGIIRQQRKWLVLSTSGSSPRVNKPVNHQPRAANNSHPTIVTTAIHDHSTVPNLETTCTYTHI